MMHPFWPATLHSISCAIQYCQRPAFQSFSWDDLYQYPSIHNKVQRSTVDFNLPDLVYTAKSQNLAYLRGHICSVVNIMRDIYSA